MRTAWKVFVKDDSEGLVSVIAYGRALIKYKRRIKNYAPEWLRKKGYHPLIFKREKDAKFWAQSQYGGKYIIIEKVEVGKKMPLPVMCDATMLNEGKIIPDTQLGWPQGTMMVEWVRPFKEKKAK